MVGRLPIDGRKGRGGGLRLTETTKAPAWAASDRFSHSATIRLFFDRRHASTGSTKRWKERGSTMLEEGFEPKKEDAAESILSILSALTGQNQPSNDEDTSFEGPREKRSRLDEEINAESLLPSSPEVFPRPSLNYRQLAYLAMKNANFMPLQTPHICDFVEHVFPYFGQGDEKWKLKWRNALSGGVRTAKCDDRLFKTNSMWGSGLRMFYMMNMERAPYFDEQINRWKESFDENTIFLSGLRSLEEVELVCSGKKGIAWIIPDPEEHMERYRKSTLSDLNPKKSPKEPTDILLNPEHCHPAAMALIDAETTIQLNDQTAETPLRKLSVEDEKRQKEKAELRRIRKNERVQCLVCSKLVSRKSLPRHLRGQHRFGDAEMMGYKMKELEKKIAEHNASKAEGNRPSEEKDEEAVEIDVEREDEKEHDLDDVKPPADLMKLSSPPEASTSLADSFTVAEALHHLAKTDDPPERPLLVDEEESVLTELDFAKLDKMQQKWMRKNRRVHCRLCNKRVSTKSLPRHLRTLHGYSDEQIHIYHTEQKINGTDEEECPSTSGSQNETPEAQPEVELDKETLRRMWKNRRVNCRLCCKSVNRKSLPRHLRTLHGFTDAQVAAYHVEENEGNKTEDPVPASPLSEFQCTKCFQSFSSLFARRFHEVNCGNDIMEKLFKDCPEETKPEICIRLGTDGLTCGL